MAMAYQYSHDEQQTLLKYDLQNAQIHAMRSEISMKKDNLKQLRQKITRRTLKLEKKLDNQHELQDTVSIIKKRAVYNNKKLIKDNPVVPAVMDIVAEDAVLPLMDIVAEEAAIDDPIGWSSDADTILLDEFCNPV